MPHLDRIMAAADVRMDVENSDPNKESTTARPAKATKKAHRTKKRPQPVHREPGNKEGEQADRPEEAAAAARNKQRRRSSAASPKGTLPTNGLESDREPPVVERTNTYLPSLDDLVKRRFISADTAVAWKKNLEDEKYVKAVRAEADRGDAEAMYLLGYLCLTGCRGLEKDCRQARAWFQRSAELDHVPGMAGVGWCLLCGEGGPSDPHLGWMYLGRAAGLGSEYATCLLGEAFVDGCLGLRRDVAAAARHFRKVAEGGCEVEAWSEEHRKMARLCLRQLEGK